MPKRTNYISRDEYFMWVALLSAHRSKDPSTQVGACIVDTTNRILGIWYNGFPRGCHDDEFSWSSEGDLLDKKNTYVVHAEANAILNTWSNNTTWARLYVTHFPCHECTKLIIQSGICDIIYISDIKAGIESIQASKHMLDSAGVIYHQLDSTKSDLTISFNI